MSSLNCLIGDIVCGFVKIEFVLSQILSELGLRENRIDFFAESQTKKKLEVIRGEFKKSEIENRNEFIKIIDELDDLRNLRNIVVHSLLLTNTQNRNAHLFHNYQKSKNIILNKTTQLSTSDLYEIRTKTIDIHNALVKLHFNNQVG